MPGVELDGDDLAGETFVLLGDRCVTSTALTGSFDVKSEGSGTAVATSSSTSIVGSLLGVPPGIRMGLGGPRRMDDEGVTDGEED